MWVPGYLATKSIIKGTVQSINENKPYLDTRLHGYQIINKKYNQNIHNTSTGYLDILSFTKLLEKTLCGYQATWLLNKY